MISKVFHQYWTDPHHRGAALPDDAARNRDTWLHVYPEFAHALWTDKMLPELLSDVGGIDVWSHVLICRMPAMRADLVRLGLVFRLGGFWVDLKNQALQRLPNEVLEHPGPVFVEHRKIAVRSIPDGFLSNSFFGAPAGSAIVLHVLQLACRNVADRKSGDIFHTTGPGLLSAAIVEHRDQVKIIRDPGFWGELVERTPLSYNQGEMHWSARQQNEGLYW